MSCGNGSAALGQRLRKSPTDRLFIDESGISERPARVRTWGLKAVIQIHFNLEPRLGDRRAQPHQLPTTEPERKD